MTFWRTREELSQANRLRRSYYELLRDQLDQQMIQYGLIDSFEQFNCKNMDFPYVEKRELKPRARIPDIEYDCQNSFLVIFMEDIIPDSCKKYIRFFDSNKTIKGNLLQSKNLTLSKNFNRNQKYLESARFFDFFQKLLPVDYCLLIQKDSLSENKDRYFLSHFHVRIDWPITDAAENLGLALRYISKDIYEKGEKYAEDIEKKFFEYYGLHASVGGRRTAAIVAAQFLKRIPCISTLYVCSSESRSLTRISERGTTKYILLKLTNSEIENMAETHDLPVTAFRENYVVLSDNETGTCIFQVTYSYTSQSRPPDDGKLRELKSDMNWLSISGQHIVPRPGAWKSPPLSINIIYT